MKLEEIRESIENVEARLADERFVVAHSFERNGRTLHLALTGRLHKAAKKAKVWKSAHFLAALKNASYGFEEQQARSLGGKDGIFLLDRTFTPRNEMMRKIFDRFLDHPESSAGAIATELGAQLQDLLAVRLVSHHLRLLGVLHRTPAEDWLVLVDFDNTK